MTKKETILEKVQKLLAKAKGTDSLAEAEVFMAKANELLILHELSMTDLEMFRLSQDKSQEVVEKGGNNYFENDAEGQWEINLITMLADFHFCDVFFQRYKNKKHNIYPTFTLVGTAENIAVVKMLFEHFRDLIRVIGEGRYVKEVWRVREKLAIEATSCEEAAYELNFVITQKNDQPFSYLTKRIPKALAEDMMPKSYADNMKGQIQPYFVKNLKKFDFFPLRSTYIKSFLIGACDGFRKKLREQRDFMTQSPIGERVTALVHVKNTAIKEYMAEKYPKMGTFASPSASDGRGYTHGVEEGRKLTITSSVVGAPTRKAIVD